MSRLILAASTRVHEPIHLLVATVLVTSLLVALAITSAIVSL